MNSMTGTKIDSRWIGLNGPTRRISWIQNALMATITISSTHPADGPVRQGAFRGDQLDDAEHERRDGGNGVQRDQPGCLQQRREAHGGMLHLRDARKMEPTLGGIA